ncbi:hypothetical protein N9383_04610 [Granulosicoccus sp.]|nr:hypothetical protein [Granulosicoccus sp.]
MDLKPQIIAPVLAAGLVLSLLAGVASTAHAVTFGVKVVNEKGVPVSGASVCFGLPGNYKQFGALFTDTDGQVTAEVPNIPFVVTISKTRFSGMRINEPGRSFNLIKQVTLTEGVPGPRCKAGSTLAESEQSSIKIIETDVADNGRTVSITPLATGEPTDYRLSESPESVELANWQTLDTSLEVPADMTDLDIVYLQMRRYAETNNGWLEARSSVVPVLLPLKTQGSAL